jgi:hypothetical protein
MYSTCVADLGHLKLTMPLKLSTSPSSEQPAMNSVMDRKPVSRTMSPE